MAKRPKIKAPVEPAALRLVEEPVKGTVYAYLKPAPGLKASQLTVPERVAMAQRTIEIHGKIPRYIPRKVLSSDEVMYAVGEGARNIARKYGLDKKAAAELAGEKEAAVRAPAAAKKTAAKGPKTGTKRSRAAEFIAKHKGVAESVEKLAPQLAALVEVPLSTAIRWLKAGNTK